MDQFLLRFLFFLTIYKIDVRSFITRLPCILYTSFNLIPNKYIEGNIAATFIASSINDCGAYCVRSPTCEFANFNTNQKTCQILSSYGNLSKSLNNQEWQVLLTDSTSKNNIGPLCENNTPCQSFCRDTCLKTEEGFVHSYFCADTKRVSKYAIPSASNWHSLLLNLIDANSATTCFIYSNNANECWMKLDLKQIFQIDRVDVLADASTLQEISGCKVQASFDDSEYETFAILNGLVFEKLLWIGSLQYLRIVQYGWDVELGFKEISIWSWS